MQSIYHEIKNSIPEPGYRCFHKVDRRPFLKSYDMTLKDVNPCKSLILLTNQSGNKNMYMMIYDGLYEKIVAAIKTAAAEVYPIYLITKNGIYKYVSQISINHWFKFKITLMLRNWDIQYDSTMRKKEWCLTHSQEESSIFLFLFVTKCELTSIPRCWFVVLPGKHFSLQLYAEGSVDAIIYCACMSRPQNPHRWTCVDHSSWQRAAVTAGVRRQIWVIRQVGPLSSSCNRLSKRIACHTG